MNSRRYLRGFIIGSIVGMATSFLFIPQKNKNTRNMGKELIDNFNKGMGILKR